MCCSVCVHKDVGLLGAPVTNRICKVFVWNLPTFSDSAEDRLTVDDFGAAEVFVSCLEGRSDRGQFQINVLSSNSPM